jgi:hypothetical protein
MKKILLIVAIAGMAVVSCKKDRVCSCKTVQDTSVSGVKAGTVVTDYEYTMVKTGWRAGYNHCIHTKTSVATGTITVDTDSNCSLK